MDYRDYQQGQSNDQFWFRVKNDLINVYMKKLCGDRNDLRILNVGAGTGDDIQTLNQYGAVTVVDIDEAALALIDSAQCYEVARADACDLPYGNDSFDVVVSFDVLEHIRDHDQAVEEIHRVLKPGGMFLFTVPAFQSIFTSHDQALHHQRRYSKQSLQQLLQPFSDARIHFWNSILFVPAALVRILKKRSTPEIHYVRFPKTMNTVLYQVVRIDNRLIKKGYSLPFGLSLSGYCIKDRQQLSSARLRCGR